MGIIGIQILLLYKAVIICTFAPAEMNMITTFNRIFNYQF